MITILVDHNIEGQSLLLAGTLGEQGWLEFLPMRFVRLTDVGLPSESSDREVWRFAQANQMFLLTNNRNSDGKDSLQQILDDENTAISLPVINIDAQIEFTRMTTAKPAPSACWRLCSILKIILAPNDNSSHKLL